jgi:hypothetical protein
LALGLEDKPSPVLRGNGLIPRWGFDQLSLRRAIEICRTEVSSRTSSEFLMIEAYLVNSAGTTSGLEASGVTPGKRVVESIFIRSA